jgi:predicted dehydrogenase
MSLTAPSAIDTTRRGRTLRIGIVGCGVATTVTHAPTLLRLRQHHPLEVVAVCDPDERAAGRLSDLFGSAIFTSHTDLLTRATPEILLIAAPDATHAAIALDAMNAGVTNLLVEKPLATTRRQVDAIESAARRTGTHITAGTMLAHDRTADSAIEHLRRSGPARLVEVQCWLPDNEPFIAAAGQPPRTVATPQLPASDSALARLVVLSLVSHNIPHLRALVGGNVRVQHASLRRPFGSSAVLTTPTAVTHLDVRFDSVAEPLWTLSARTDSSAIEIRYPPSYVQAGGASARVTDDDGTRELTPPRKSTYAQMWEDVMNLADAAVPPHQLSPASVRAIDDARCAVDLADQIAAFIQDTSTPHRTPTPQTVAS